MRAVSELHCTVQACGLGREGGKRTARRAPAELGVDGTNVSADNVYPKVVALATKEGVTDWPARKRASELNALRVWLARRRQRDAAGVAGGGGCGGEKQRRRPSADVSRAQYALGRCAE